MMKELVLRYRAEHDITQQELADRIGVTAPTIGKIEAGEMPSKLVIAKVAMLLGVSYKDLEKGEESGHV